ncbi:isopropylmalate/homocitrate/citramalate synthase [Nostoc sp. PCC 7524]|uniref:isopropylmalate/homocitrate/citramalate synthase n=1 Tax=Nostoc sp. (strain ATCC 29411 / PCC 7524) TaxID=28072 RepID=UPI00029F12B4|nr:isopropylmalate/homocitrate/citramalate synthase [Nostoc sp. PCC 7524]AFY49603.1 isopropylmalate/homocitrate/citramalate synthase [Nostoc sp. PCC 7524]
MNPIRIFDTTMRDGELTPGVQMNLQQKIALSQLLEQMGVDIIEVGYPGNFQKDFHEVFHISQIIKKSTICGLASASHNEITTLAAALKPATKPRIHTYTPVNLKNQSQLRAEQTLEIIKDSISLARNYTDDVEWSAFDAPRSQPDFLCKAIETAIKNGATTISIPDSLGLSSPAEFSELLQMIFHRVPNIEQAVVSVHCHDDLGMAVENSLIALNCGVKQIECAVNGLGARKGNADLEKVVMGILQQKDYQIDIDISLMKQVSELVAKITGMGNTKK